MYLFVDFSLHQASTYTYLTTSDPHVFLDFRRFELWLHSNPPLVRKEKTTFVSPTFPLRLRVTRRSLGPSPA